MRRLISFGCLSLLLPSLAFAVIFECDMSDAINEERIYTKGTVIFDTTEKDVQITDSFYYQKKGFASFKIYRNSGKAVQYIGSLLVNGKCRSTDKKKRKF